MITIVKSRIWVAADGKWKLAKKRHPKKTECVIRFCTRPPATYWKKGVLKHESKCQHCKSREWRANNPVLNALKCIKSRAKRTGIPFFLTKEQFIAFCKETGFVEKRGRASGALHIDRIDPAKGYEVGNIQVLTASENVRKRHADANLEELPDDNEPF